MKPDTPSFLVYGPSGSGVHTTLKAFREFQYQTFAGVPLATLGAYLNIAQTDAVPAAMSPNLDPYAITPANAQTAFENLKKSYPDLKLLYLSTPTDALISRYTAAEKKHPYDKTGLREAIEIEQLLYQVLKLLSDYHIDTTTTTDRELGLKIAKILDIPMAVHPMTVTLTSFGFKHGIPPDADMVFDMRFLPNPFYDETLRPQTGLDKPVQDYVMGFPEVKTFLTQWQDLIAHVIPLYQREGKTRLQIATGCTGGQHRSVAMTLALAAFLKSTFPDADIRVVHREQSHWPQQKVSP